MLNQIHHGDCLELMQHLPAGSIDMILCDLPYGTTACKWDTIIPFDKLWAQYERVIKPNGAIVLTAVQPFTTALIMSKPKLFRYELIWEKSDAVDFLNANRKPLNKHENINVFYTKPPTYNPQKTTGHKGSDKTKWNGVAEGESVLGAYERKKVVNTGERFPTSVLQFKRDWTRQQQQHPTQKPVALFEYLIRTYTNPGDVVLDNCAGSFTTSLAAENTGRQWICIEQEAKYCEIGAQRIAANRIRLGQQPAAFQPSCDTTGSSKLSYQGCLPLLVNQTPERVGHGVRI